MKAAHHFHASHEEHGHDEGKGTKFNAQWVALFLGLCAVLIAICSGLVSSEQNKISHVLIAQDQATSKEVAASVKIRLVLIELNQAAYLPKEQRNKDAVLSNLHFYKDYLLERNIAHDLAESMNPSFEHHLEASEMYEFAQLLAEITIAIGSVSLILKNRYIWYVSILFAVLSFFQLAYTRNHSKKENIDTDPKIEALEKQYVELRKNHMKNSVDSTALKVLDPDGSILNSYK